MRVGIGAYLVHAGDYYSLEALAGKIRIRRFEDTSSTKLELQTVLWALSEVPAQVKEISLYTDSQNIANLALRREKLEATKFLSKNGRLLNNHDLYRKFYAVTDRLEICVKQVRGHIPSREKTPVDKVFSLVDRASRNALRAYCEIPGRRCGQPGQEDVI